MKSCVSPAFEVHASLTELFKDKVAPAPVLPDPVAAKKEKQLAWLKKYIAKTTKNLAKDFKQPVEKISIGYKFKTDFDISPFKQEEFQVLLPELEALHNFCMERNVHLALDGFDILPKTFYATDNSWSVLPKIGITVDRTRIYNGFQHPRYLELKERGFKATWPVTQSVPGRTF